MLFSNRLGTLAISSTRNRRPTHKPQRPVTLQIEKLEDRHFLNAIPVFTFDSPFTVTNTNDSGAGSLRQAILDANAKTGTDTIVFDMDVDDSRHFYYQDDGVAGRVSLAKIASTATADDSTISDIDPDFVHSWWSIQPTSALPTITDSVIIDGYSQAGAKVNTSAGGINAVLRIELNGSLAGAASGLAITAGGSTVRGLAINSFAGYEPGYVGGAIELRANDGSHIEGNFIGTDISGTVAPNGLPNFNLTGIGGPYGVEILPDSGNNWIGTNGDGVNDLAERNLISANNWGVVLRGSSDNVIAGNLIGTDRTGTKFLGNWAGIGLLSHYEITSDSNRIGTNADGISDEYERNVISANRAGIGVGAGGLDNAATNTLIAGNDIGVDVNGAALGNFYVGIWVAMGANTTQIGGPTAASSNTIAFNGGIGGLGAGVTISDYRAHVDGNRIQGNSIHSNFGLGIDLTPYTPDGVTQNDSGDTDAGPNNLQNFPVLTSVFRTGDSTTIAGTLNGTFNTTFTIELFSNTVANSALAEGETFLGTATVTTDAGGNGSFTATFATAVPEGQFITATATDSAGNTSEFSACQAVAASPTPTPVPGITLPGLAAMAGMLVLVLFWTLRRKSLPTITP